MTSGTARAHVEDSTTSKDTTAPSGKASLGAHVSETSQATSPPPRMVGQILGEHDIDDTFWENTNPTDVSIDTVNSEEQMAGSHITEFHTPKDEEIVPEDLLSQVNQHFDNQHDRQLMVPKHDTDHDPFVDGKLITHENESIPSVAMQDQDHTDIMDKLRVLVG